MARWEYLYFTDAEKETSTLHPPGHKEKLNELGKEGWELRKGRMGASERKDGSW